MSRVVVRIEMQGLYRVEPKTGAILPGTVRLMLQRLADNGFWVDVRPIEIMGIAEGVYRHECVAVSASKRHRVAVEHSDAFGPLSIEVLAMEGMRVAA